MDAIELLKTRRSCRQYKDEYISDEELQTIIDCGLNAPSAKNLQSVKIVVVTNKDIRDDLSRLNSIIWKKEGVDPFYGAPIVCLIVAPENEPNYVKDGSLVLGAMQDGAYALNVGSCWINRCKEMLELEDGKKYMKEWGLEGYAGVGCCILGYPASEATPKQIKENRVIKVK